MMLRPRDSHDQRVIEVSLEINPAPSSLRYEQDDFGNHIAIAEFAGVAGHARGLGRCRRQAVEAEAEVVFGMRQAMPRQVHSVCIRSIIASISRR